MMKNIYILLVLVSLFVPASAYAWNQTMTCDNENPCEPDQKSLPTYWKTPCVFFYLNESGTKTMDIKSVQSVVSASVNAWNLPKQSALTTKLAGLTNEDRVGYNPYIDDNANIIVFRDNSWDESRAILALTTVMHQKSTGEIFDADIEMNSKDWKYGIVERDGTGVVDLQNTLTHEIGHAFGLAHSDKKNATMFPYSQTGETSLRSLDADDIEAISTIYPKTKTLFCKMPNDYFDKPALGMDEKPDDDSCSARPNVSASSAAWFPGLMAILALFAVARRRKQIPEHK